MDLNGSNPESVQYPNGAHIMIKSIRSMYVKPKHINLTTKYPLSESVESKCVIEVLKDMKL